MLRIRPYILAGGKSSRMGRDKAMLELEGKTLLARAVETLRSVERLGSQRGSVEVTVCGAREALGGADRAIVDRFPECGPLGGIEAALRDLEKRVDAEWAFFIPVDMPLLAGALIDRLLASWSGEIAAGNPARAFMVECAGRAQPLVSLVHRSLHGAVREALEAGKYKVQPVLQSAGAVYTSLDQRLEASDRDDAAAKFSGFQEISVQRMPLIDAADCDDRPIETSEQFLNVNTEADLMKVATLLGQRGLKRQPERLSI